MSNRTNNGVRVRLADFIVDTDAGHDQQNNVKPAAVAVLKSIKKSKVKSIKKRTAKVQNRKVEPYVIHGDEQAPSEDLYVAAVAEIRQILADVDTIRQMRIGALADQVAHLYQERRLEQLARDTGIAACTIERYRSVHRAWQTTEGQSAPEPISYSVAKALQAHPDRFELIRQNPNLSKRAAEKIKRQHAASLNGAVDPALENNKRWFTGIVECAVKILENTGIVDSEVSPELREILLESIEVKLLPTLEKAAERLIKLKAFREQLVADSDQEQS